jgi:RNA polymerase sigma-70 factor (ECF subfamily)
MSDATSIKGLIECARAGQQDGLAKLLEHYRNYLALLARTWVDKSLQGKADASDLVQETLIKAHERFGQFRGYTEPEIAAWLRQILAYSLADFARRFVVAGARQVSREQSLEEMLNKSSQAFELVATGGGSPSQSVARREASVVLADALAELPQDYREVIVLHSLQELDWAGVAARMNRSEGAVRMLWVRALKHLRPLIEARL